MFLTTKQQTLSYLPGDKSGHVFRSRRRLEKNSLHIFYSQDHKNLLLIFNLYSVFRDVHHLCLHYFLSCELQPSEIVQ